MLSRRQFFAIALAQPAVDVAGATLPPELHPFKDPSTELRVVRLTDPRFGSYLPAPPASAIARRGQFLVFSSDAGGSLQPYRMETRTGESKQLAEADGLLRASLTLAPDERSVFYVERAGVRRAHFSGGRARSVYDIESGCEAGRGLGVSGDGQRVALVERRGGHYRLRWAGSKGEAATLVEADEELWNPTPRPGAPMMFFRRGASGLWAVNFDGSGCRRLPTAEGAVGPAMWTRDGQALLYLNTPADPSRLANIREIRPEANTDKWVSDTSKFASFSPNGDASVFAGASGSKVSPYVILLLRWPHRELTVAEHHASDPSMVTPLFSQNSQRLFFQSDREGKMAIYMMNVERLVAETEAG